MPRFQGIPVEDDEAAQPAAAPAARRPRFAGIPVNDAPEPAPVRAAVAAKPAASTPAPAKAVAPQARSTAQKLVRGVGGLGTRNIVEGVADLAGIFYDPIADGVNWLGSKGPTTKTLITGKEERYFPRQFRAREMSDALLDSLGVPKPETADERIGGDVGRALTGTALTMGAGSLINALRGSGSIAPALTRATAGSAVPSIRVNPTVGQAVSNYLVADPVLQAASTVAGSAAVGTTREAGFGPGAQAVAGILAGLAPGAASGVVPGLRSSGAVPAAVSAATKRVLRGRNALGEKLTADDIKQTIKDFEAAGTTGSIGQVGQGRTAQVLETIVGNVPGGAGKVAEFGHRQARQVGDRVDELAAELTPRGARVEPAQVGRAISKGVEGPGGFKDRTRETTNRLYDELDQFIDPQTRVGAEATSTAFPELNPTIPSAPNLSPLFQNAKMRDIGDAFERDLWGNKAVATRPGMAEQIEGAQGTLKEQADEISRLNQETAAALERENVLRTSLGQKPKEHVPYPVMGRQDIDGEIQTLLTGKADGKLPFEALKKLRTLVGKEMDNASLLSDVPRDKWTALYAALSDDMKAAAEQQGPEAMRAWSRANAYYSARVKRLESIEHVIDKNGGPEAIYQAATGNLKWGGSTLSAVMKSLPAESQKELTAMVLRRMGRATPGVQNAEGDRFSMSTFLSNWDNVSKDARRALFDRYGTGFSQNMDQIARMASKVRDGGEVFRNPSGSARLGALMLQTAGAASTAGSALINGMPNVAAGIMTASAASAGAANAIARAMTKPKYVAWLASNTNKPIGELMAQLKVLNTVGERDGDDDLVEAADAVRQAVTEQETE